MRKAYDLDSPLYQTEPLSKDLAYSRYLELTRSAGPSQTHYAAQPTVPTFLIEPSTLLREGLKRILAETAYNPVASSGSLNGALSAWSRNDNPFLVILDATRDHGEACSQIQDLKEQWNSARVIMLVDHYDLKQILSAYQAGADAYLMKSVSCDVLVKTLDLVMLGETVFPSAVLELLRAHALQAGDEEVRNSASVSGQGSQIKGLSTRETVILRCLMEGDSNKLIARKFDITEATVKVHVKAILRKIRAKNRTQAAIWAASHLPADKHAPAN